ncbi:hypothetical protein Ate01nite_28510 [Actinoplanes teichomyceticus]|nr:hypothetical protein Ate01nite_28510 [Actinoplanes teichomyceticus]
MGADAFGAAAAVEFEVELAFEVSLTDSINWRTGSGECSPGRGVRLRQDGRICRAPRSASQRSGSAET